jgi:hypothetical protein
MYKDKINPYMKRLSPKENHCDPEKNTQTRAKCIPLPKANLLLLNKCAHVLRVHLRTSPMLSPPGPLRYTPRPYYSTFDTEFYMAWWYSTI